MLLNLLPVWKGFSEAVSLFLCDCVLMKRLLECLLLGLNGVYFTFSLVFILYLFIFPLFTFFVRQSVQLILDIEVEVISNMWIILHHSAATEKSQLAEALIKPGTTCSTVEYQV